MSRAKPKTQTKTAPKKAGRKPKLVPELVAAALVTQSGNVAAVAKKFGVTRQSVQGLISQNPALAAICLESRESMKDHVEAALYRAAKAGEGWAVCFFLKTQGRDRGYVERQEHIHAGSADLLITRVIVDHGSSAQGNPSLPSAG